MAFWFAADTIPASATIVTSGSWWGDHERRDRRDHRQCLGLVGLERLEQERESAVVGQQPDRDLWFEAAFLGKPRLPEPLTLIGFK